MTEISIRLDVPEGSEDEIKVVLNQAVENFERNIKLALAKKIISKSSLTEADANLLSKKIKRSMHDQLIEKGLI